MTSTAAATSLDRAARTPASERILFVEDNPGDARLIALALADAGGFDLTRVESLRDATRVLSTESFDGILLDLSLPDAQGAATFEGVHAAAPNVPVVVMTGLDDENTALAMVHAGAQDYLVKGVFAAELVARSLRYALERQRLRQSVEAAQHRELDLKNRFLSRVSHELRSPLAVSYLYATNVLDGVLGPLTAEQQEHLGVAVDGLRAQMRLIDELLATVRSDASLITIDRVAVSIPALIARTLEGFGSRPNGIALVNETCPGLPRVLADPVRLQQVLTNLVDNALKVSPAGGTVRIGAAESTEEPGFMRIDVSDEGPSVPDAARARIFECLVDAVDEIEGPSGLGLGLYLSKLLVARHGGRIWVESAGARGTRFSFTLPFSSAATADRMS